MLSAALGGTLTSHAVAQLNDLAYRDIRRAGLRTRLERRVAGNLDLQAGWAGRGGWGGVGWGRAGRRKRWAGFEGLFG